MRCPHLLFRPDCIEARGCLNTADMRTIQQLATCLGRPIGRSAKRFLPTASTQPRVSRILPIDSTVSPQAGDPWRSKTGPGRKLTDLLPAIRASEGVDLCPLLLAPRILIKLAGRPPRTAKAIGVLNKCCGGLSP